MRGLHVPAYGLSALFLPLLVAAAVWAPGCGGAASVAAQVAAPALQVTQEDRNGDGRPDVAIITGSVITAQDRILVFDSGRNMAPGADWRTTTDFTDDTWLFDSGANGSIELVIRFSRQGDATVAELFDDQDGDGAVAVEINGGAVRILETPTPPLRVIADGDWYLPDGRLNWNVRLQTDGSAIPHLGAFNLSAAWQRFMRFDGQPDAEIEFKDADRDGVPEYGLWRLLAPAPEYSSPTGKAFLWANVGAQPPAQPSDALFWPYLSLERPEARRYFEQLPRIVLDWQSARIVQVAFVGYPIEQGFHINSLVPFEKQAVNYANFENMQAFYDLDGNRDGNPELHIRHRYFAADDPFNFGYRMPTAMNEIRWSWRQRSAADLSWDYKLGLAGRRPITTTLQFADFAVTAVPYAELPGWVMEQDWDYATFVAAEQPGFASSEGVYLWGALEQVADGDPSALSRYLAGATQVDVAAAFQTIPAGWRGSVAAQLEGRPTLYLSPVDRKLHLLHATSGVWNVDDQTLIRYANLNGDGYFDQFTATRVISGALALSETRQLTVAPAHLIYAAAPEVIIRRAAVPASRFETPPPVDARHWLALRARLEAADPPFAPDDLKAMLHQFDGPEQTISGAVLRDYRPQGAGGFRFALSLAPDFRVQGAALLPLAGLSPGDYLVVYDGAFSIAPLAPPQPSVAISSAALTQHEPGAITLRLNNTGLADLPAATLELWAAPEHGAATLVTTRTIALLAQAPLTVTLAWAPPAPGQWTLTPRLRWADAEPADFAPARIGVQPAVAAGPLALVAASSSPAILLAALLGISGFVGLAALTFARQWSRATLEQNDDPA